MKRIILTISTMLVAVMASAQNNPASVNLAEATIVYNEADAPLIKQMAQVLADDIERTSGTRPQISTRKVSGAKIFLGTVNKAGRHRELKGTWERYAIDTNDGNIYITGSDARGGPFRMLEGIGTDWLALQM